MTQKERQYRFFGERLNPIPLFSTLAPPPTIPQFPSGTRQYTSWQPAQDNSSSTQNTHPTTDGDTLASPDHF